jgi:hypothetical protein
LSSHLTLSLSLSLSHPNLKKKKIEACADEGIGNVPLAIADLEFSMRLAHSLAVDFCTLCCWGTIFEASQARTWYKNCKHNHSLKINVFGNQKQPSENQVELIGMKTGIG